MTGIRTLAIIKPDAVASGKSLNIIHRIQDEGFIIRAQAQYRFALGSEWIERLYKEHKDRPFFAELCEFMASGPVIAMVLEAPDAVYKWRSLMGATDSRKAEWGTIRHQYGDKGRKCSCGSMGGCPLCDFTGTVENKIYRNAVHGSDSDEAAEREIAIFFGATGTIGDAPPSTLAKLNAEIVRGRKKFPGNRFMLAGLIEELGELAEAIASGDAEQVREEALQVAAVAIRIVEEGEATKYQFNGLIQLMAAVGRTSRYLMQRKPADRDFALGIIVGTARELEAGDPTFDDITDTEAQA